MRGQYAQRLQGRDNSIEVFQQQGPVFVLLGIITSFFPSSISYMTSGIHGNRRGLGKKSQQSFYFFFYLSSKSHFPLQREYLLGVV